MLFLQQQEQFAWLEEEFKEGAEKSTMKYPYHLDIFFYFVCYI